MSRQQRRHAVICLARPPGWMPASPAELPPEIIYRSRVSLGQAAALALELNAAEIAKGPDARRIFLAVKTLSPMTGNGAKGCKGGNQRRQTAGRADHSEDGSPRPSYADAPSKAAAAESEAAESADASPGSMKAFAELQSYCSDLPDTPEGRFERVMVSLIFDTGIPRWELAKVDLSAIDLDAGRLTIDGEGEFTLSPFTVAAVREWMTGQAGQQPQRSKHSGGRAKRYPRVGGRRAAG